MGIFRISYMHGINTGILEIEKIEYLLNTEMPDYIPVGRGIMQRGVGDIVEAHVRELIIDNYPNAKYPSSPRSIEDVEIQSDDITLKLDIKTHNLDASFSRPNLISIKRLNDYYKDPNNSLAYIFVSYKFDKDNIEIFDISVAYIEHIKWDSLSIGNLGKGQLQVNNMHKIEFDLTQKRNEWIDTFRKNGIIYYNKLTEKIQKWKKSF